MTLEKINAHSKECIVQDECLSEEIIPVTKFLVFNYYSNNKIAVKAEYAEEILRNIKTYDIPFAPEFITGMINQHGKINVVISLEKILSSKEKISEEEIINLNKSKLFVSIKGSNERNGFCIKIENIKDFYEIPDAQIENFELKNRTEEEKYFAGNFIIEKEKIFFLDIEELKNVLKENCKL